MTHDIAVSQRMIDAESESGTRAIADDNMEERMLPDVHGEHPRTRPHRYWLIVAGSVSLVAVVVLLAQTHHAQQNVASSSESIGDAEVQCVTAVPGTTCYKHVHWAMTTGLTKHRHWYPGLNGQSSFYDWQMKVHRNAPHQCPPPCVTTTQPPPTAPPLPSPPPTVAPRSGCELKKLREAKGDCAGGDVVGQAIHAGDASKCQDLCISLDACKAFVFWPDRDADKKDCYPKQVCNTNTGDGDVYAYDAQACREEKAREDRTTNTTPGIGDDETVHYPLETEANKCGQKKMSFYMYRAQDNKEYELINFNAADLAGVLWYLHHEVVVVCPRKFNVTRIRRIKVTMQNTCKLKQLEGSQFGPYVSFDSGRCTIGGCQHFWDSYGFVVGCQHIPYNQGMWGAYCTPQADGKCHRGHWYSFPGPCPTGTRYYKSPECLAANPGGNCNDTGVAGVTGARDCTYRIDEDAGEVYLDELYDWDYNCWLRHNMEYNNQTDSGVAIPGTPPVSFWDGIYDPEKGQKRIKAIQDKFAEKYPHMPVSIEQPICDWYKADPKDFLHHTGSGARRPGMPM